MKTKSILYDLIKSMSQTEKRHFKIYASKYTKRGESNFVKLFNVIDKFKFYDEKRIIRKLSKEKFIKRLALEKHLLYKLILKSLRNYHSDISIEAKIYGLLIEIEVLFSKALYEQCFLLLKKAEQLAKDHEKKNQLLIIFGWERKLSGISGEVNLIKELNNQEKRTINEISNLLQYYRLFDPIAQLLKKKGMSLRDKDDLKILERILKHPLLLRESKALSNPAMQIYHNIHAFYSYTNSKFEQAHFHFQKRTELIESFPSFIKNYEGIYISSKYNSIISLIEFDKNEALKEIENFRAMSKTVFKNPNSDFEYRIFSRFYELELVLHLQNGMFEEAKDAIKEVEKGIQKYERIMEPSRKLLYYYLLASLAFGNEDFKKSLKWIYTILNTGEDSDVRQDLMAYSRILSLIIHFEMGNDDLLPYLTRSVYRNLLKKGELYAIAMIFLKFIKKESKNIYNRADLIRAFVSLKKGILIILKKDTTQEKILIYFDFISWLESKIQNRPFAEIVRERAGHR